MALCENIISLILLRHPLILLGHLLQALYHGLPLPSYPLAGLSLHLPALSCLLRHPLLRRLLLHCPLLRPFRAICGCVLVGLYVVVNLPWVQTCVVALRYIDLVMRSPSVSLTCMNFVVVLSPGVVVITWASASALF